MKSLQPHHTKESAMQRLIILCYNIIIIKLNKPGVRLSFVLNFQLNSVLAKWTDLVGITINIDIVIVVALSLTSSLPSSTSSLELNSGLVAITVSLIVIVVNVVIMIDS